MRYGDKRSIFIHLTRRVISNPDLKPQPSYIQGIDKSQFQPHEWVLDAMDEAFRMGVEAGKNPDVPF